MKSEKAGYQAQGAYNADGSARASETMKSEKAGYQFAEQEQKGLVSAQAAYDAVKGTEGAEAKIAGLQKRRAELDAEIQNLEVAEESCSYECERAKKKQNSMEAWNGWTVDWTKEGREACREVTDASDKLCLANRDFGKEKEIGNKEKKSGKKNKKEKKKEDPDSGMFYIACCDEEETKSYQVILATEAEVILATKAGCHGDVAAYKDAKVANKKVADLHRKNHTKPAPSREIKCQGESEGAAPKRKRFP